MQSNARRPDPNRWPERDGWCAPARRRAPAALVGLALIVAAACQAPVVTEQTSETAPPVALNTPGLSPAGTGPATLVPPSASPGFAFDPESIVGYYQTLAFRCGDRQPSAQAAGYEFQSCQLVDADGRTRTVGFVTDPDDNLADAFLSIRGTDAEAVLDPATVLDPFGGFLGATLGEAVGSEMLPWLAGHLGDAYETTTLGNLTLATYTESAEDHAKLTVEIATGAYLAAPRPSQLPGAAPS
jgi:hypothetical protein